MPPYCQAGCPRTSHVLSPDSPLSGVTRCPLGSARPVSQLSSDHRTVRTSQEPAPVIKRVVFMRKRDVSDRHAMNLCEDWNLIAQWISFISAVWGGAKCCDTETSLSGLSWTLVTAETLGSWNIVFRQNLVRISRRQCLSLCDKISWDETESLLNNVKYSKRGKWAVLFSSLSFSSHIMDPVSGKGLEL